MLHLGGLRGIFPLSHNKTITYQSLPNWNCDRPTVYSARSTQKFYSPNSRTCL